LLLLQAVVLAGLVACRPAAPALPADVTATPPEAGATRRSVTCADLDAAWGVDWPTTLAVLDRLIAADQDCGPEPLAGKQYAAHVSYAVALENIGELAQAVEHYRAALALDARRREAWDALVRLNSLPPPTPATCLPEARILRTAYPAPAAGPEQFVSVRGDRLALGAAGFRIRGVNYYPRSAPWHRFLLEADGPEMAAELDLIAGAGFNTIRIFLWYDALFTCRPEEAVPIADRFAVVDTLLVLARERGLKVIVTLNDLPDLTYRPLYSDRARTDAQTALIVERYRGEPAILAWDLRNEGDLDYGARSPFEARFTDEQVLAWLAETNRLVKANDPQHLTTAGWWGDPTATAGVVDFLSFHHWYGPEELERRIADYRARTGEPLVLGEVGYHSWAEAPGDARDEAGQAERLAAATAVAEAQGLSGWLVWTAFDFAPPAGQAPTIEHFFGLWRGDLTPKPALAALPLK
jgi:tetratricopeptide (TPR) repeat protein